MSSIRTSLFIAFLIVFGGATARSAEIPGVVINHIPSSSRVYIGSPGIAILPNGDYVAKHDEFGPGSAERKGAVTTPDGHIVNVLRVDYRPDGGKAAVIRISNDSRTASFDPGTGFIDFPGGCKKFAIRFDPVLQKYWALSNPVLPRHIGGNPERTRNAMALMCSENLYDWNVRCVVVYHPDTTKHGFQYPDWMFDGADIIAASRTAWGQGKNAAHNQHDANYLTFHRIKNFRALTLADSADGARPGQSAWQRPAP